VHDDPDRDLAPVLDMAKASIDRLTDRLKGESPEEALAETMAGDLRLSGDLITYDHPDNADVIAVAERRKGLPVTWACSICTPAGRAAWSCTASTSQATSCCASRPRKGRWPWTRSARAAWCCRPSCRAGPCAPA
jgi:hypothetical protein